jgi:hypothetical protein
MHKVRLACYEMDDTYWKVCEFPRLPVKGEAINVNGKQLGQVEECGFDVCDVGYEMTATCWSVLPADELVRHGFVKVRPLEVGK